MLPIAIDLSGSGAWDGRAMGDRWSSRRLPRELSPLSDGPVDDKEFLALCARINAALDARDLIQIIDYHADKAIRSGGLYRMYCPIHGDTVFRTLLLNPRRNTVHCEYSACAAHQPMDFIELLARCRGCSRPKAVVELIETLGPQKLKLNEDQEGFLRHFLSTQESHG